MKGFILFAKSRHLIAIIAIEVGLCVAGGFIGAVEIRPTTLTLIAFPVLVVLPLVPAVLLGVTVPGRQKVEHASRRPIWLLQFSQVAIVTCIAVVGFIFAGRGLPEGQTAVSAVRNLFAFEGLALIGAAIVGRQLSWALPLGWVLIVPLIVGGLSNDPSGVLLFFAQPDEQFGSWALALTLWAAGSVTLARDFRGFAGPRFQ